MLDIGVRKLLLEIKTALDTGTSNCYGIMAFCNNCLQKCDKYQNKEKLKKKIDEVLEVL